MGSKADLDFGLSPALVAFQNTFGPEARLTKHLLSPALSIHDRIPATAIMSFHFVPVGRARCHSAEGIPS